MNCRETESLIVPFIKSELNLEKAKIFFEHIDMCRDCREELEVYYILLIGLKQLDEDSSGSLDLHGQFEEHLNKAKIQVEKTHLYQFPKMVLFLALIGVMLVLATRGQEKIAQEHEEKNRIEAIFSSLPQYDPIRWKCKSYLKDSWEDVAKDGNEVVLKKISDNKKKKKSPPYKDEK